MRAGIDKTIQLAIGITGKIRKSSKDLRGLMETMDGHYREELVNGPGIRS